MKTIEELPGFAKKKNRNQQKNPACEQAVTIEVTEVTLAYLGCLHENTAFRSVLLTLRRMLVLVFLLWHPDLG